MNSRFINFTHSFPPAQYFFLRNKPKQHLFFWFVCFHTHCDKVFNVYKQHIKI